MALVPRAKLFANSTQHLIPDSLTQNAGVVTAVIGAATLTVNVGSPAANTIYFLYMRMNGPTSTLFSVVTTPSVYRASFPEAILIGAYYSNGAASPAFGSFVNINGIPMTNRITFTPTFGAGVTSNTNISFFYERTGAEIFIQGTWTVGAVAASLVSASIPTNLTIDTTSMSISANTTAAAGPHVGWWTVNTANPQRTDAITALGTSTSLIYVGGPQTSTPLIAATGTGAFATGIAALEARLPISGWSNIPLKDL